MWMLMSIAGASAASMWIVDWKYEQKHRKLERLKTYVNQAETWTQLERMMRYDSMAGKAKRKSKTRVRFSSR